jgi:endonuclease/exonuclease/phosphatase family metal-dependent hydrolase
VIWQKKAPDLKPNKSQALQPITQTNQIDRLCRFHFVQIIFTLIAQFFFHLPPDRLNLAAMIRRFIFLAAMFAGWNAFAGTFRIATYNLENYLDQPSSSRPHVKSAEAKAKIREYIRTANPDVLALEEMGSPNTLLELRAALKADGLDFPFWEHIQSFDTNIHLAVLSKFPIVARRSHTNEAFLLDGKRFLVKRGFVEVDIQAATNFTFTLFSAHLKSHLSTPEADEAEERFGEAKMLRGLIDTRLAANPDAKLVVLGDFNDDKDSPAIKAIVGRGKSKFTDTRPAERNGDNAPGAPPYFEPRNVAWTYYYGKTDTYSRIDYIFLSPAMKPHWLPAETYIPTIPNWGIGSDHRPIVAGFTTGGK